MICKSQWVEQTEKAFEQTILNKDKINKLNTGSKNNSFLVPTLTFQLWFLLYCANWPFHSFFFFNFFHGQVRENLSTPLEEPLNFPSLKVICWKLTELTPQSCEILQRFVWGEEGHKLAPGSGVSEVKCFVLVDFFAMFTSLMFK